MKSAETHFQLAGIKADLKMLTDVASAAEVATQLTFLHKRYPGLLKQIWFEKMPADEYAAARKTAIRFNSNEFNSYKKLSNRLKKEVQKKWSVTDTVGGLVTHEFGHIIDESLKANAPKVFDSLTKLWNQYRSSNLKENLSQYASYTRGEFVAEAFAEYIHSSEPREIASKVGEIIDKHFKVKR
jgi:hypothetical protein